jgi:glycosyltransferase involved in cell wall biosynthesis
MRIRIFGVFTETGVGTHARNILAFLQKIQNPQLIVEGIDHTRSEQVQQAIDNSHPSDINIHLFPDLFASRLQGQKLYWAVFESTRPPADFLNWFALFDRVISPSRWGRDCMIGFGAPSDRVTVIPEGVDPWVYHPYTKRSKKELIRFLMVGKYESRKGYEVALQAFELAFEKNPRMELWVKPDWLNGHHAQVHPEFVRLAQRYHHLPITVVNGILSTDQMISLYQDASYLLFPSLCEGWGLPLIEAMASGLPVICCEHGGQSEYLNPVKDKLIFIPYTLSPINCETWKKWYPHADGDYGKWASIDPAILANLLLHAANGDHIEKAFEAAQFIRKEFSWERSVDALMNFIFQFTPAQP